MGFKNPGNSLCDYTFTFLMSLFLGIIVGPLLLTMAGFLLYCIGDALGYTAALISTYPTTHMGIKVDLPAALVVIMVIMLSVSFIVMAVLYGLFLLISKGKDTELFSTMYSNFKNKVCTKIEYE